MVFPVNLGTSFSALPRPVVCLSGCDQSRCLNLQVPLKEVGPLAEVQKYYQLCVLYGVKLLSISLRSLEPTVYVHFIFILCCQI